MSIDINTACLTLMGIALLGGLAHRIATKKGIGWRFCQFLALGMGIPLVAMLAAANQLDREAVATIVGAVLGVLASRAGKDET